MSLSIPRELSVRPSPLPAYRASEFKPQHLNLREGEQRMAVCPECGIWRRVRRNMIWPHHFDRRGRGERAPRCAGSARRIIIDVRVEEWGVALVEGEGQARNRRSAPKVPRPFSSVSTSVARMGYVDGRYGSGHERTGFTGELEPAYERARRAVAVHRDGCPACRSGALCAVRQGLGEKLAWTRASWEHQRRQQTRRQQLQHVAEHDEEKKHARRRSEQWRAVAPAETAASTAT